MKKKLFFIIIIVCFFTTISMLGFPLKIFADEINVYAGGSIRSSVNIAMANGSDTDYIYIGNGTYNEQVIINIPAGQELHLIGESRENTIISLPAGITGNVLSADGGGKIYLEKVTITNGTRSGIYINNNIEFLIEDCCIENNISTIGGGINSSGGTLSINNSRIINNSATLYGGGIYNDGTLSITNSIISSNSSVSNDGGGIYNLGNLVISGSSIFDNTSINYSGIASIDGITGITNTAQNNWWGSETGPYNSENNPLGTGNSVADNIDFQPFLLNDPFSIEESGDDGQNNDDDIPQNPDDSHLNNTSEDYTDSSGNNPYGNIVFSDTGRFPIKYYYSLYDSPLKGFITLLYNSILLREPDDEGFNHWEKLLCENAINTSDIAGCLFFSEENNSRITDKDNYEFLEYLYSGILFRKPDNKGFGNWLTVINDGKPRKYLFDSFTSSEEWKNICLVFNVNP